MHWSIPLTFSQATGWPIAMRNFPRMGVDLRRIVSIGAVAVPLNAWWQTDEMVFALDDCGATVVFVDEDRLARIQQADEGAISAKILAVRADGESPSWHYSPRRRSPPRRDDARGKH